MGKEAKRFKQETETKVDFLTELADRNLQFLIDPILEQLGPVSSILRLAKVSQSWNHIIANSKIKT